ncbi:MAG: hypothetical protein HYY60_01700 [Parcubacteria group bacterium]|nr:hypothetical protein [Parcubacteria group bacterium]MBI3074851.1 hypothetical protein [Parcubacteria group bacterium]
MNLRARTGAEIHYKKETQHFCCVPMESGIVLVGLGLVHARIKEVIRVSRVRIAGREPQKIVDVLMPRDV